MLEMVERYGGLKNQLAQKLGVRPPTITVWCQSKIDPAGLEISIFNRIASLKGCSVDELANLFELKREASQKPLQRLRHLVREMLVGKSQEQLGQKLNISKNTIRGWLNPTKNIDPNLIPAGTIANLATEKGWTIEKLLAYLNLKKNQAIENDVIDLIESQTRQLSLSGRVKILSSLFGDFEKELSSLNPPILRNKHEIILSIKKISLILEQENLAIATNYATNLAVHLQLKPENIQVTTIPKLPDSLADIDVLIFDISSADSASIALIKDLKFEGNIVVFAAADLPQEVLTNLSNQVTEVVVKPIDWKNLKDKEYLN